MRGDHSSLSPPEKLQPSHELAWLRRLQESEPIQDRLGIRLKIHKAENQNNDATSDERFHWEVQTRKTV